MAKLPLGSCCTVVCLSMSVPICFARQTGTQCRNPSDGRAIRDKVGNGLFLMVKLRAVERDNAIFRWRKRGNTLEESAQIAQWAEVAGEDAIHVSTGSIFPHPRNPAGAF